MKPPKPNLLRIFLGELKRLLGVRSKQAPSHSVDCLTPFETPSDPEMLTSSKDVQVRRESKDGGT
jgi:hypothetical protein